MFVLGLVAVSLGLGSLLLTLSGKRGKAGLRAVRTRLGGGNRVRVEILGRASVGHRQGVAVVRIGEDVIAVSVGDGGVHKLADVSPDAVGSGLTSPTQPRSRKADAARHLTVLGALALSFGGVAPAVAASTVEASLADVSAFEVMATTTAI